MWEDLISLAVKIAHLNSQTRDTRGKAPLPSVVLCIFGKCAITVESSFPETIILRRFQAQLHKSKGVYSQL